jgi:hypothetical protein
MLNVRPSVFQRHKNILKAVLILNIVLLLTLFVALLKSLPFLLGLSYMYQVDGLLFFVVAVIVGLILTVVTIIYCSQKAKALAKTHFNHALIVASIPTLMIVGLFLLNQRLALGN